MEREYFRDRPESVQYNKNLYKGETVFICLKKMQPFAKEISDLTMAKITANLTTQYQHPRGQKIRGDKVDLDIYGNKLLVDYSEEVVGRCTYIVDDNCWSLDTNEGKKFLIYNKKKRKLDLLPYDLLRGYMKIVAVLKRDRVTIKIPLCRFTYFNSIEKAEKFINSLVMESVYFKNDIIIMNLNGKTIFEDDIQLFVDKERLYDISKIYDYIPYDKNVPFDVEEFLLEKIL